MAPKFLTKNIWKWGLYDWANSAFATTIIAGFFPIFFKQYWSADVAISVSTARLGSANAIAGLLIALAAPILGSFADKYSKKQQFLMAFAILGISMTASLYWISKGQWVWAILVYVIANIGFSSANIFYDSLLIIIAPKEHLDQSSTFAYALGYLGGGLLFLINVLMTLFPTSFGLESSSDAVRLSFLTVALWWATFSLPLFLYKEPKQEQRRSQSKSSIVKDCIRTIKTVKETPKTTFFLLAYWFYMDGVWTVIKMAVDYGLSLGFSSNSLIVALLLTQFIGFPSALLYGKCAKKWGTLPSLKVGLYVYCLICTGAMFMQYEYHFYLLAALIGIIQGGVQALSRSYFATLVPIEKTAEYFGFYNMIGKFSAILGPFLMGITGLLLVSIGLTQNTATRLSILVIIGLFVTGLYFLKKVCHIRRG